MRTRCDTGDGDLRVAPLLIDVIAVRRSMMIAPDNAFVALMFNS